MSTRRQVTPTAAVVLAPNPGPMTLSGTNTWLLAAPGAAGSIVIDPGPGDERHLQAVASRPVEVILLTHGHLDHSEGARRLAELTGAAVRALDPAHRLGAEGLAEGDVVVAAGLELAVWATPGHTSDSLCFVLPDAVLTGDTILGHGTTVVAHPDGVLADYLVSLERLRELGELTVLPGHGAELPAAGPAAERYLTHRRDRLEQVRDALAEATAGGLAADGLAADGLAADGLTADRVTADIVRTVYAGLDEALRSAAILSVRAQLHYLRQP